MRHAAKLLGLHVTCCNAVHVLGSSHTSQPEIRAACKPGCCTMQFDDRLKVFTASCIAEMFDLQAVARRSDRGNRNV